MKRFHYKITESTSLQSYTNDVLNGKKFYRINGRELFTNETLYRIIFKNGEIKLVESSATDVNEDKVSDLW